MANIMKQKELQESKKIYWWSDGGKSFRNKELLTSLVSKSNPLFPGHTFVVNYFVPSHGKNDCDSVFGMYSSILKNNLPEEGIESFQELLNFFKRETQIMQRNSKSKSTAPHQFFEFSCDQLENTAQKLQIKGFMGYLQFQVVDGQLVGSQLSDSTDQVILSSEMKEKEEAISNNMKTSTVNDSNLTNYFQELEDQIKHLASINPDQQEEDADQSSDEEE
ncbi:MAG: hypothetical protein EZS28_036647 [Streblomastix strix]|uniref:Uncharacterized protein n=1 Tax=Streblomastix strix TaxID=222440 RepID=A0A5J4UE05_9EUKA|nr:MAG: hypothetical protein EZS28_036647 [Streblomastix strix]